MSGGGGGYVLEHVWGGYVLELCTCMELFRTWLSRHYVDSSYYIWTFGVVIKYIVYIDSSLHDEQNIRGSRKMYQ